jgi:hypothetical protein
MRESGTAVASRRHGPEERRLRELERSVGREKNVRAPSEPRRAGPPTGAIVALVASVAVTLLLYVVPFGDVIAYPLLLVSTVAHELGHGLAAQLAGGTFLELEMWSNASGTAHFAGDFGRFADAFIAAGGLCGPAVVAAFGFVAGRRALSSRIALVAAGVALVVFEIWVVRTLFGLFFVGMLAALCLFVGVRSRGWVSQFVLLLLSVQLALSVFSRGDYLFTDVAMMHDGPQPSDVALMSEALFLPYWFWGLACGGFSIAVMIAGFYVFVRGTGTARDAWRLVFRRQSISKA